MANPYDTLSPEDYAQQQQINRQQKMAEMLMSQTQAPQGQMVSGRYVAPSFFQYITPLVNAYQGKRLLEQGDTKQQALAEAIRGRNATELQDILGKQFGSADYKPAVPYPTKPVISEGSDMVDNQKVVMPPVYNQVGQAPDPNAAFMAASQARGPQGQALFQTLLAQKMKPPELTNVAPGGSLVRTKDGVTESVFTAPEKLSPTEMQRDWVLAKQQGYQGNFMDYQREVKNMKEQRVRISVGGGTNFGGDEGGGVNNNGIPVGTYNKNGSYTSPKGRVFPASVVNEAQKEHDAGIALINKLNNLSEDDITNAFGSLTDYSTSRIGRMAAPTKTLDAQVKINNLQIGSVLNNLSQLKGASSDKEMAQMIKDFPGYEASPDIMKNWVERASKETNRFLKMREDRFAFDTEYAQEGRFKGKNPTPVKPIPVTPQSNAPMYIVNKTTGERQMSNDGGKTWSPVK